MAIANGMVKGVAKGVANGGVADPVQSATHALQTRIRPDSGWLTALQAEFEQPYMQQLARFLAAEDAAGKVIFPPSHWCFNALNNTPLDQVRVVILGQDPYHGAGQAHGLCFSVRPGTPAPPSLVNIFKELAQDLALPIPDHGCLITWARQGVLLLNSVLTVEQGRAGSHQGQGWETFTDRVIALLNDQPRPLIFMLWGSYAQKKGALIDCQGHLVLEAPHPSPLSAYRGFLGCGHFSQANQRLLAQGQSPIDWRLPSLADLKLLQH